MSLRKLFLFLSLCLPGLIFSDNLFAGCSSDDAGTIADCLISSGTTINRQIAVTGSNPNVTNNGTVYINPPGAGTSTSAWGFIINGSHSVTNFTNSGSIDSATRNSYEAVSCVYGCGITNFVNSGDMSFNTAIELYGATGSYAASSIGTITNTGTMGLIYNGGFGGGNIGTLNNDQGASSSALTFSGKLPTNYNIIINSASDFGKIAFTSPTSTTTFGIYTGSSVSAGRYASVITGLSSGSFASARLGTYGGYNWVLDNVSGSIWDLVFSLSGPSATDTQSSLTRLASRLRGSYNTASLIANFPNSNTYDCNLFDVKGMCISAGGRYSTVDNPSSNSTAAVVTLGYKVNSNIRIGGFLDQSVNNNNPTGVYLSNSNPMMGAFAYWNQNPDGLGYQVKLANAYQDKDLSTTRDVIGTSEAGRGTTSLTTQSYVGELSYAFMFKENTLVRPYFALRHTSIEQDAYTETGVSTPLTYSALNDRTTSALMGVKFKHALTPKANLIGSLGLEQDLHNKTDRLTATGVSGLTSENFSGNLHRTRPVASLGATYDIAKSQRLSGEVLVQQLPFQSTAGATAYFNYMIGF